MEYIVYTDPPAGSHISPGWSVRTHGIRPGGKPPGTALCSLSSRPSLPWIPA